MIRKMCPVCDLPIHGMNYCPRCKKIVRNPYTQKVDYYLNEGHPNDEVDCEFHDIAPKEHHPERRKEPKADKSPSKAPVLLFAVVCFAFLLFTALVGAMRSIHDHFTFESYESDYVQLTDEEVLAAGVECNGYKHFPTGQEEIVEPIWAMVKEMVDDENSYRENQYSDNYEFEGEVENQTYYETIYTIERQMETEDTLFEYIDISCDTVSGNIHSYTSSMQSQEASALFLKQFLTRMESKCNVSPEESRAEEIMWSAENIISGQESGSIEKGMFRVMISTLESQIYVNVYYNSVGSDLSPEL